MTINQNENYNPYDINAPTLMIGLGGLGSWIVRNVYSGLPDNYKKNTVAHIMDTDVAELKAEDYAELLNQGGVTQTSPPLMVADCLDRLGNKTSVAKWFPAVSSLDYKQMIKGAAQVRSISRLAMLDTINSGRINSLNHNIDNLLLLNSDGLQDSIRVVIVNSLAGGTGSGSFMQIALYVREYLERRHNFSNATFRSFLVMPEIFINNGDYSDGSSGASSVNMERTVRANGYACFKEIDALIRQRGGEFEQSIKSQKSPLFPMGLEYQPGQKDEQQIEQGASPFDVITVFDYSGKGSNENIANLGNKAQYINQVEDAIKLHLFSPLEGRGGLPSREDNLANLLLESSDRSRYAGCGSSSIEYPLNDLTRYMALRWIDEGVSKQWRELDELINDEIRSVLNDRAQGIHAVMPDRTIKFCELLRDKAEVKQPQPFYKAVYDQTHELDENGWRARPKHQRWVEAIGRRLDESINRIIKEKESLLGELDEEVLQDFDIMVNEVREHEYRTKQFADALDLRIQTIGTPLAKDVVWRPYNKEVDFERSEESQINTWLLGKDEPIHPIAIRYFLGEAKQYFDKEIKRIENELERAEGKIDSYPRKWDHPDTENVESSAVEYATVVVRKPLASWRKGLLRDFSDEYQSKNRGHVSTLKTRAKSLIYLDTYKYLQGCLDDFLQYWEKWFENLEALSIGLQQELRILETKHDNPADRSKIYVRASSTVKQALWEEEGVRLIAEEVPTDISREIYLDFYHKKGNHYQNGIPTALDPEDFIEDFRKNVLGWCEKNIQASPAFNMNVAEAIDDERRLLQRLNIVSPKISSENYLQEYLGKLNRLALPWVLSKTQPQRFGFTCLTPDSAETWGDDTINDLFHSPMINAGFSRYKITRMSLLYGLTAPDLISIADKNSQYQLDYKAHLAASRQRPPKAYTPHLNRYWDSPAFLPELHDDEQAKGLNNIYRTVLYTLANQLSGKPSVLINKAYDSNAVWHESPRRGEVHPILNQTGDMIPADTYGMILAFACNYDLVEKTLEQVEAEEKAQRNQIEELTLFKKIDEIISALNTLPQEAPETTKGVDYREMLVFALVDEVQDVFYRIHGMPNSAFKASEPVLTQIMEIAERLISENEDWGKTLKYYAEEAINSPKY